MDAVARVEEGGRMSHYKEYAMGIIDEDEFRMACAWEFRHEDDDPEEEEDDEN